MKLINTPHGTIEVLQSLNKKDLLVRFVETGGTVITTQRKIDNGTVTDPMAPRELTRAPLTAMRWKIELPTGEVFEAPELSSVALKTGVHVATVRKIAQGTRRHDNITSITRI